MRTYGRLNGTTWVEIDTDPITGDNTLLWVTTLVQVLKLNLNESPFWADWGIPAQQTVAQQIFPDYYVALIQQRFAPYFASLIISKQSTTTPIYLVNVTTNVGDKINAEVPV